MQVAIIVRCFWRDSLIVRADQIIEFGDITIYFTHSPVNFSVGLIAWWINPFPLYWNLRLVQIVDNRRQQQEM